MSSTTVSALDLAGMLSTLAATAARASSGDINYPSLVLYTQRGQLGGEVGECTFLCGVSSTGVSVGATEIVASGDLEGAWMLSPGSRSELQTVLKSWIKEDREGEVRITVQESGRATAKLITMDGRSLDFLLIPADDWPIKETFDMLSGSTACSEVTDKDGNELPAGRRVSLSQNTLKVLLDVAKQKGGSVDLLIPKHPASVLLAERDDWVGAVLGEEYPYFRDVNEREAEYLEPDAYISIKRQLGVRDDASKD